LKVTEVKVQNVAISLHVSLLFDLEYSNIMLILIVYISTKFRPDQTSNIAARWSPWNHTFASIFITLTDIPDLITFSLSIILITFSLSRTTVKVSHVAADEHMVLGPFHVTTGDIDLKLCT
jgi:hypothetical protein